MYLQKKGRLTLDNKITKKLLLSIIATGMLSFAGIVIETAMNVAFPTIIKQFSVTTSTVQWLSTGVLLIVAIIVPASSFLKKSYKTKTLFITAAILFFIGLLIGSIAPNFGTLLIARLLQGVGIGISLPLMYNIILEQVPFSKIGLMMGFGALITAIGPALGPVFGGVVCYYLNWRFIFIFLIPVIIISFILGVCAIEQKAEPVKSDFDYLSFVLLAISFICLILGVNSISHYGVLNIRFIGLIFICLILISAFIIRSSKTNKEFINLAVFKNKIFCWNLAAFFILQLENIGLSFVLPNYTQITMGESILVSGLLFLPGDIFGTSFAPLGGKILDVFGAKKPIMSGMLFVLVSFILFSLFGTSLNIYSIIIFFIIFRIGFGLSFSNIMTNGINQAGKALHTDGNAVYNTMQQLAGAIGVAVMSTIVASSQTSNLKISYAQKTALGTQHVFVFVAVLSAIGLIMLSISFRIQSHNKNK